MFKYTFVVLLILALNVSYSYSQNVNEQRYRLAESFEQNGDLQGALRIYSELIKDEPKSDVFFDGYVRVMKQLNNYSELLKSVQLRISSRESLEMMDLYAELNWRTGNPDEANKFWNSAIKKFESSQSTYLMISQTQINLRLFEKAINTLLSGRKYFGDPRMYNDPLVKLYIAVGNYKAGTSEILSMLNIDFNLPQAQGRMFALMINEDAKQYIGEELQKLASSNQDNIIYQEVYSWYLRSTGRTDEALELIVRIDKLKNTKGLEIINFGSSASRDGDFETAIKAFKLIVSDGKRNPYASSALFGLTRAMEDKIIFNKGKLTKEAANEIIESYNQIINYFPRTSNAADSRMRVSQIYSNFFKDNTKAINQLEMILKEFPNSQYAVSAYIELGLISITNDDLENSEKLFSKVNELNRFSSAEQKDKAMYYKALIVYFKGEIDKAKNAFAVLALNPDSDIANDVLKKLFLINSNEQFIAALEFFAKSELKEMQNKPDEAIANLKETIKLADKTTLGEAALYKSSEIEYNRSNFKSSRDNLTELLQKYPESKNSDKYIMMTADSYFAEDNAGEALKYYTELITKYPESIYLQDARKKIRIIRKDKI